MDSQFNFSGVYEGMYEDIMSVSNKQFQEVLDELEEEEEAEVSNLGSYLSNFISICKG